MSAGHEDIRRILVDRVRFLQGLLADAERRLARAPEGSLRISEAAGRVQYYYRTSGTTNNGIYIPKKEQRLARRLARKDYDQKLIRAVSREIKAAKQYLKYMEGLTPAEEIYECLPEARRELVIPAVETETLFLERWNAEEYQGKDFPEDYPEFLTGRGERVRSKTEVIIADLLAKEGIPYRYECPVLLQELGTVYPDFTVLNVPLRREILWEHLGMMDDPEYAEQAVRKLKQYVRSGYLPGENLIVTMETKQNPVSLRELKLLIEHFLM